MVKRFYKRHYLTRRSRLTRASTTVRRFTSQNDLSLDIYYIYKTACLIKVR